MITSPVSVATSPRTATPVERRPEPSDGGPLLFSLLFWFGLATCVELCWLGTPVESLWTVGDAMTAASRLTGMVSGFVLLVQVLLQSRIGWLERGIGAHALLGWHRRLGWWMLAAVQAHLVTGVIGYAAVGGVPVLDQAWIMLTRYQQMGTAFAAAGLLVAVALLAIRGIRTALPYELWYWLHRTGYGVLLLAYGHQFEYGQELIHGGFGWWYWTGLHVLVLSFVVWGRGLRPLALNLRHRLRVAGVVPESQDTVSIYVTGRYLDRLGARGGQFFRWRFLTTGAWWQSHPFSLSAAPNGRWLRLTVRAVGQYTTDLHHLEPGVPVVVHGPSGVFTASRRRRSRALLIAWGSGIGPVRALVEELPPGAVLVYRARSRSDLVFHVELAELARDRVTRVHYVLGRRTDLGPRHLATPAGIRDLAPDVRRRDVYLCGPADAVRPVRDALRRLGVPRRQIHLDAFEF
ncbi:MAG TPA: ferredoxin reductase family protein [Micromonosporaceae bacterium]